MVDQGNKILLPVGLIKSTSISVKYNGTTNTSKFLHGLFLMYLHEAVITTLCLHLYLTVYIYKNISYHLYKGISTIIHLYFNAAVSSCATWRVCHVFRVI